MATLKQLKTFIAVAEYKKMSETSLYLAADCQPDYFGFGTRIPNKTL